MQQSGASFLIPYWLRWCASRRPTLIRRSTVSFTPVCCSGRVYRRTRPTCSSTPWCRTRPTARCCASRDARFMPASPKPLKSQFAEIAENQPELLARHCTEAGLIEKAASLWGKAGQRSLERSALVEAVEQLTRALDQIATLPATPALRREQIKLQVALITPLIHVKGYAAPETKAAAERARLLIEQAEALGEPPEDPLLLFSVLYGFWVANYVAFNGDVMRELAAQFLALAEKQGATVPLMIGHRLMGIPCCTRETSRKAERTSIRRSRFTILPSIVRWRRDLAKTSGWQSCPIGRWRCGCLAIPRPRSRTPTTRSRMRARSAKPPR